MEYPEIDKLIQLQRQHNLKIELIQPLPNTSLKQVRLSIDHLSWDIFVDDEYGYFNADKQLICICLVLRSLEDYKEAADYLQWCNHHGLNASETKWLEYYKELGHYYSEIEHQLGEINSFISSLDYQLRSGPFAALLEY